MKHRYAQSDPIGYAKNIRHREPFTTSGNLSGGRNAYLSRGRIHSWLLAAVGEHVARGYVLVYTLDSYSTPIGVVMERRDANGTVLSVVAILDAYPHSPSTSKAMSYARRAVEHLVALGAIDAVSYVGAAELSEHRAESRRASARASRERRKAIEAGIYAIGQATDYISLSNAIEPIPYLSRYGLQSAQFTAVHTALVDAAERILATTGERITVSDWQLRIALHSNGSAD